MDELKIDGIRYHKSVVTHQYMLATDILIRINALNKRLTPLEVEFSETLGEASRWLEHLILFLLTIAVLSVEGIGISLTVLINHSVTKRMRELEERTTETRAAIQMKDEFLSIASHELRTPLTSLSLELQLLARRVEKLSSPEEKAPLVTMAEKPLRSVKRLTVLLDELLDLTRIQVGKFEVHPVYTDLVPILHDCVSKFSLEASQQGASISIHSAQRLLGYFDPSRIEQVLTNLISNALKYGQGSNIEINAAIQSSGPSSELIFSITDHGPGIALEKQSHLFDRFERGEANPNIKGLGLGLYISKQIIDAHLGTLTVDSALGKGTTFTVHLLSPNLFQTKDIPVVFMPSV